MPPQELVSGNDFFNLGGSIPRLPTGIPHPMLAAAAGWMPPPPGNYFLKLNLRSLHFGNSGLIWCQQMDKEPDRQNHVLTFL